MRKLISVMMYASIGVEGGDVDVCLHQSHGVAWGAGALAGPPDGETAAQTPPDHLRNQFQVPRCMSTTTAPSCFLSEVDNILNSFTIRVLQFILPSVLWHCWLGGRKGIRPVKNFEWWAAGVVICLERGADLHMAQLMPLPLTISCSRKIQICFTFLVLAHLGSPGQGPLNGCVCVCCSLWWY